MTRSAIDDFIAHHDDRWLFVVVYVGLAVVLSMVLSLFWLLAVAGLHFWLECLRQAPHRTGRRDTGVHALWEIKLDLALVLLALALTLYMDVVMGLLGLQSAARATAASRGAVRVTRFAAWQRNLRAVVLMADDLARVVQAVLTRALRRTTPVVVVTAEAGAVVEIGVAGAGGAGAPGSWRDPWSAGDQATVMLAAACVLLMACAPLVTAHTWSGATLALLAELHPFPVR